MDVKEHKQSTSSTTILDGAQNNRIDWGEFTSVAGNSTSNTFILVKLESGIGIRSMIVLVVLVFLIFPLSL